MTPNPTETEAGPEQPRSVEATPATASVKKKWNLPGMPDLDAEVIVVSLGTLLATNRFTCEVCGKVFQLRRARIWACVLDNRLQHKEEDLDSEEEHIRAQELLHNVLEVSIASSSARKVKSHVQGVDSRISGRFWALGSDSETDEEEVIMVDDLVSSIMSNLSIASPARPPVPRPNPSLPVSAAEPSPLFCWKETATSSSHVRGVKTRTHYYDPAL